ncbi:unnamed protein product [Schistosoma margrebowiei]|uniref:Uncharacterized protein n=1 Tax=Schistosoma margrebowiei TaxID=48269 RepID=A0A3P7W4C6_9TREM|nr:unnamed protein product [Schistosoma margrebowiei]
MTFCLCLLSESGCNDSILDRMSDERLLDNWGLILLDEV